MNMPNYGYGWQTGAGRIDRTLFDEGLRQHMLRVYNYMGIGLVLTGLVAYIVGTTPALYVPIFSTPLKWVVMLAPLAFASRRRLCCAAERSYKLPSTRCDRGSVMIVNYNSLGRRSGVQSEHCMSEVLKGNLNR